MLLWLLIIVDLLKHVTDICFILRMHQSTSELLGTRVMYTILFLNGRRLVANGYKKKVCAVVLKALTEPGNIRMFKICSTISATAFPKR